ncbi:MAG: hypothetical protein KGV51_04515 [Moraxellaceae bacterium]|nr:hypothetical protein [Moraxellaceae bacterium]
MHNISPQVKRQFVSTYEQAINTGMEKGIQTGIIKTAKNLKKMGLDMQIISKSTGLSLAEIKKL